MQISMRQPDTFTAVITKCSPALWEAFPSLCCCSCPAEGTSKLSQGSCPATSRRAAESSVCLLNTRWVKALRRILITRVNRAGRTHTELGMILISQVKLQVCSLKQNKPKTSRKTCPNTKQNPQTPHQPETKPLRRTTSTGCPPLSQSLRMIIS